MMLLGGWNFGYTMIILFILTIMVVCFLTTRKNPKDKLEKKELIE